MLRHSRRDGAGAPRSRPHEYRINPAGTKRMAAANSGGTLETAMRMAKNVEPQTM